MLEYIIVLLETCPVDLKLTICKGGNTNVLATQTPPTTSKQSAQLLTQCRGNLLAS